jgi:hypothetical protein
MVKVAPCGTMMSPITWTMPDQVSSPTRAPDLIIVGEGVPVGVVLEGIIAVGDGLNIGVFEGMSVPNKGEAT